MNDRSHNFVNTRPSCPPVPQQDKRDECYYEAISSTMPTPSIYEQPRETATYNYGCTMSFQSANVRTNAQNTQDDYLIPHQNSSTRGQYVASDSPYLAVSDWTYFLHIYKDWNKRQKLLLNLCGLPSSKLLLFSLLFSVMLKYLKLSIRLIYSPIAKHISFEVTLKPTLQPFCFTAEQPKVPSTYSIFKFFTPLFDSRW